MGIFNVTIDLNAGTVTVENRRTEVTLNVDVVQALNAQDERPYVITTYGLTDSVATPELNVTTAQPLPVKLPPVKVGVV